MDDNLVMYRCSFCGCSKKELVYDEYLSVNELGCDNCKNKTCKHIQGMNAYIEHVRSVHGINIKRG